MTQPTRQDGNKDVYLFSHTQFTTHNTCPKKYKLHYVDRVRPRRATSPALIMGQAFHAGLENIYAGRKAAPAINKVFAEAHQEMSKAEDQKKLIVDQRRVDAMVAGYEARYLAGDQEKFKEIHIEEPFEIVLAETDRVKLCYEGYIDAIGITNTGKIHVFEHKTASQINQNYWNRVKLDWQVLSYAHGVRSLFGKWPLGVVYSVIKKTQIRLKSGESIAAFAKRVEEEYLIHADAKGYFDRQEFLYDRGAVERWLVFARAKAKQLYRELKKDGPWLEHTNSCLGFGGFGCDFMNVCCTREVNDMLYEIKPPSQYRGAVHKGTKG